MIMLEHLRKILVSQVDELSFAGLQAHNLSIKITTRTILKLELAGHSYPMLDTYNSKFTLPCSLEFLHFTLEIVNPWVDMT